MHSGGTDNDTSFKLLDMCTVVTQTITKVSNYLTCAQWWHRQSQKFQITWHVHSGGIDNHKSFKLLDMCTVVAQTITKVSNYLTCAQWWHRQLQKFQIT